MTGDLLNSESRVYPGPPGAPVVLVAAASAAERKELLKRVYAILWRRAQLEMGPPRTDTAEKRP